MYEQIPVAKNGSIKGKEEFLHIKGSPLSSLYQKLHNVAYLFVFKLVCVCNVQKWLFYFLNIVIKCHYKAFHVIFWGLHLFLLKT